MNTQAMLDAYRKYLKYIYRDEVQERNVCQTPFEAGFRAGVEYVMSDCVTKLRLTTDATPGSKLYVEYTLDSGEVIKRAYTEERDGHLKVGDIYTDGGVER